MPEDLSGRDRVGIVALIGGEQSVRTVLEVGELVVCQAPGLGKGQVQAGDGLGIVGIAAVGLLLDAVPHLHADHEIVTHPLFLGGIGDAQRQQDTGSCQHPEQRYRKNRSLQRFANLQAGNQDHQCRSCGSRIEHAGQDVMETVVVNALHQAVERIREDAPGSQETERGDGQHPDGEEPGSSLPVRHFAADGRDNEQETERTAGHIDDWDEKQFQ